MTFQADGWTNKVRFYADSMLGKFCRWLRLMGYDVQYATSDMNDNDIIEICQRENLVLITRDDELSHRYSPSVFIRNDDYHSQLREFISLYPPDRSRYFSRCPLCNGPLEKTSDSNIMESLPEGVKKLHDHVYVCRNCGKIYWEGSHYFSIMDRLNEITGHHGEKP